MSFTKTLSRDEMKNITAGIVQEPGGTNCVICWNEGENDAITMEMDYNGNDPNNICRRNGPYASGSWGEC